MCNAGLIVLRYWPPVHGHHQQRWPVELELERNASRVLPELARACCMICLILTFALPLMSDFYLVGEVIGVAQRLLQTGELASRTLEIRV